MEKIWLLYMVRCNDNSLYTGITFNIKNRYTSKRRPVFLVYVEELNTSSKSIAMKREYKVKHLKKKEKEVLILSKSNIIGKYKNE